ncbi:MAG: hypothetical protein ACYTF9_14530 [Planctomycetota bacterium]|jgi:hypothetical protein
MPRVLPTLILAASLIITGCSSSEGPTTSSPAAASDLPADAETALRAGTDFFLFSVDPDLDFRFGGGSTEGVETFRGWKSLGSTTLAADARDRLVTALRTGVLDDGGVPVDCFIPRHGIRVTHDEQVHEFVICFQCSRIRWFIDGAQAGSLPVTTSPRDAFNAALVSAGLPLAE